MCDFAKKRMEVEDMAFEIVSENGLSTLTCLRAALNAGCETPSSHVLDIGFVEKNSNVDVDMRQLAQQSRTPMVT